MSFVKQHALLHKHCLHKYVMNERTVFTQSAQKENIRADCAPPPAVWSCGSGPAAAEAWWRLRSWVIAHGSVGRVGDGFDLSPPAFSRSSALAWGWKRRFFPLDWERCCITVVLGSLYEVLLRCVLAVLSGCCWGTVVIEISGIAHRSGGRVGDGLALSPLAFPRSSAWASVILSLIPNAAKRSQTQQTHQTQPNSAKRLLVWLSTEAVASFHSPVLPFFPPCLLLLSRLISIEETLSARLSKLENYGFDQLVSQRNWYHLLKEKSGFWGTRLSRRDVRGRIYEGCMGEVANRMSGGSFCGGRWGYLPFRHHDNRYSADWIRLCPGLSENSEDGNSCPKPHKAARFDWSRGKSGQQWDWDYKPEYGCHHVETYGFASENWWFQRPEWTERIKLWRYAAVRPKRHNKI